VNKKNKVVCSVMMVIAIVTGGAYQADIISTAPIGTVEINGKPVGDLMVSQRALEIIGNAEGCRLEPYKCPAGLLTDGIGNTHNVTGQTKTYEQIAKDWVENIQSAQKCLIDSKGDVLISQGHIDAFTSFIFNTGCTRFRQNPDGSETRIYKYIHKGEYKRACNELRFWVFSGGVRYAGLVERRHKETALCLTP
jgi:lysozyme